MTLLYRRGKFGRSACFLSVAALAIGCGPTKPVEPPKSTYSDLGPKEVPDFLKNTIWQVTDLANSSPIRVSGYGLVVNLDGTGDTSAPNAVREYMLKQMEKHGFGSGTSMAGLQNVQPERVLNDPDKRTAIVRVDGFIPPGAHRGQAFDVQVSALENSNTTSLHRGDLYEADLAPRGADPFNPGGGVINPWARVQSGPININPAYALDDANPTRNQKLSMRYGMVMNRGVVAEERPIILKLRQPERRVARQIEARLNERFQSDSVARGSAQFRGGKTAQAKDEGEIWLYVPASYRGDWERFVGVAMHTYFNGNADYASVQAQRLVELAAKDGANAPLLDISYCWEALGPPAIPALSTLYASPVPEVAYAAARAGAFLEDLGAQDALARIARTANHPFQVDAVKVLGSLTSTAQLRLTIRGLLDSPQLLVRIAAYNAMLDSADPIVLSKTIGAPRVAPPLPGTPPELLPPPPRGRFTLDMVDSEGPPIVYVTRVGEPRIAIIGRRPKVIAPNLLMAMNNKLTVLADKDRRGVQIFYRGDKYRAGASVECQDDFAIVVARLGGEVPDPAAERLRFHYTDVIGIIQRMIENGMVASVDPVTGQTQKAVFNMQSLPGVDDEIMSAPSIPEQRPQDVPTTQNVTSAFPTR